MLVEVAIGFEIVSGMVTLIVAEPDLAVFCVLVAVTVTEVPVVGAVRTPVEEMLPAEVDQVTAEE